MERIGGEAFFDSSNVTWGVCAISDVPVKIQGDYELQNWASELTLGKDDGGVGIKVRVLDILCCPAD